MIVRTLLWSLWLPVGIAVVLAVGDFSYGIYDERPLELLVGAIVFWFPLMWLLFWFPLMWLLGMPLTLAVQLIHRRSPILALAVAAMCAPISVIAYFLSVPLPSFLNSLFGAALGWLVVVSLYLAILICQRALGRKTMGGP